MFRQNFPFVWIVVLGIVSRLIPHPPNMAPITGLALFSGAHFSTPVSFIILVITLLISDIFLGFHATMIYVYGSFLIIAVIGKVLLRKMSFHTIFLSSFISSFLFFFVTNFGVWITGDMYVKTYPGLLQCYINGIPFLKNTIIGDLFYSFSFFYGYRFIYSVIREKLLIKA